jgi:N-methylhydantoinase A/oxoprolinase/acetone carboxylase beta subunit
VRTNFRTPDLLSIALGGGTRIVAGSPLRIGPESLGYG